MMVQRLVERILSHVIYDTLSVTDYYPSEVSMSLSDTEQEWHIPTTTLPLRQVQKAIEHLLEP